MNDAAKRLEEQRAADVEVYKTDQANGTGDGKAAVQNVLSGLKSEKVRFSLGVAVTALLVAVVPGILTIVSAKHPGAATVLDYISGGVAILGGLIACALSFSADWLNKYHGPKPAQPGTL